MRVWVKVGKRSQEFSLSLPAQISAYRQPSASCLTWWLCACVYVPESKVSERRQVCLSEHSRTPCRLHPPTTTTSFLSFEYLSGGAFLCCYTFDVFGGGERLRVKLCRLLSFHLYRTDDECSACQRLFLWSFTEALVTQDLTTNIWRNSVYSDLIFHTAGNAVCNYNYKTQEVKLKTGF